MTALKMHFLIFINRKCVKSLIDCKIINSDGVLVTELKKEILKKATLYKKEDKDKKKN